MMEAIVEYGGILTEFCLVEFPNQQYVAAIGVRYLKNYGYHYIVTSPIRLHINGSLHTFDKKYDIDRLILNSEDAWFYNYYCMKVMSRGLLLSEAVLSPAWNSTN